MKRKRGHQKGVARHTEIDVALAIAVRHIEPGIGHSCKTIAEICGCHKRSIQYIERNAIITIRKKFGDILSK